MSPASSPVLVVGAGPVGLTAAHRLAHHGVPVRLIDSKEGPSTTSKALVVWRRTLQVLDATIDYEQFLNDGHEVRRMRMSADGKRLGEVDLTSDEHPLPTGIFLPQSETEKILLRALAGQGVEVEWQTRLVDFESEEEGVTCQLEGPGGAETFRASWLIACDGAHSTVRHHLGLSFPGETVDRRFILGDVGVDVETDPHEAFLCAGGAGVTALFPVDASRWRVVADKGPMDDHAEPAEPTTEELQAALDAQKVHRWKITEVFWRGEFRVNERQIENYRHGRVLLAGDAAHVHSPAGGQGMNTGMQDATNLAWKVALAWKGAAASALLETYQEERHPVGRQVVQATSRMMRAVTIANPLVRHLRDAVIHWGLEVPALQRQIRDFMSEETITFRKSRLAGPGVAGAALQPGDAFPDIALPGAEGERPSTDLLRGAEAVVLTWGSADSSGIPRWLGSKEGGIPVTHRRLEESTTPEGVKALGALFGLEAGGVALMRPDGVVAAVGSEGKALRRGDASAGPEVWTFDL